MGSLKVLEPPNFFWEPPKIELGASQNFIGSLPKFDSLLTFWSLPKLLNVMLQFGSNFKIYFW